MAVEKFWDAGVFFDGRNYTGQTNKVALTRKVNLLDTSVFGVETKINLAGQDETECNVSGWWYAADVANPVAPDPVLFNALGASAGAPLLIYPKNTDLGVAYFFPATLKTFNFFGNFGDLAPFTAEWAYSQYSAAGTRIPHARGYLGLQPSARVGATGNGSNVQLSTVASSDWLVFCVHLLSTDATNVTFNLASDDAGAFSTPTTRMTTGALTAQQSYIGALQGPIATDTYFRVEWTRTGGTTFTAVAAFAEVALP